MSFHVQLVCWIDDWMQKHDMRGIPFSVLAARMVLCGAVWWVLTNGAVGWDALLVGVPTVMLAAVASAALLPRSEMSLSGAFGYAWYFVHESVRGGFDVARRALSPRMPLDPEVVEFELTVPSELARVMVANTLGLLPGSLVVAIDGTELQIHSLDAGRDMAANARATEKRVAALLKLPLPVSPIALPESSSGARETSAVERGSSIGFGRSSGEPDP